jgi:DNA processing protein
MNIQEAKSYNALANLFFGDYRELKKAFEKYGFWNKAWQELKNRAISNEVDPEKEWEKLEKLNIRLILKENSNFPRPLKEIPYPPHAIYLKGEEIDEINPKIAIVGTRKATIQGKEIAKKFASELSKNNIAVVSGLAFGIDESAHKGAIEMKNKTIAVLANGLDNIYPRQNEKLGKQILECGGTLISEYPLGSPSIPQRFIERNRLISGLSLGIIVIEAPEKSGALATARFAIEQNRDVFVVPGPINHFNYVGSHELIKTGASLITSVDDALLALNLKNSDLELEKKQKQLLFLDAEQKLIFEAIEKSGSALAIDEIAKLTKLEAQTINQLIAILVIQGIIKEDKGKYYIS